MNGSPANYRQNIRPLLHIAVPVVLSSIINQVQGLIDKAFLGRLDTLYLSAVTNATTPFWTTMSFCFAIVTGASILISQKVGAGQKEETRNVASALMLWNNVIPVLFFFFWMIFSPALFRAMGVSQNLVPLCLEYIYCTAPIFLITGLEASVSVIMQTSNHTKPLAIFGLIRALANILLDWILIFGNLGFPAMGIKGAAIATALAEYIGFVYEWTVFVTSRKLSTRPPLKSIFKSKIGPYLSSLKLGLNTALEDFLWNFGNIMIIRILNTIDEMASGIYMIVYSIGILVVVMISALGQGNMTLSSEAYGARDRTRFKGVFFVSFWIGQATVSVAALIMLVFPRQLLGLFTTDSDVIRQCLPYILLVCVNLAGKVMNIISGTSIRASGNTLWMLYTQIIGTILVTGLCALFVFVFHMGIAGVFVAVIADETVRAIINFLKYRSISRKAGND